MQDYTKKYSHMIPVSFYPDKGYHALKILKPNIRIALEQHALRRRQREEQRVVIRGAYGHWHLTHFAH